MATARDSKYSFPSLDKLLEEKADDSYLESPLVATMLEVARSNASVATRHARECAIPEMLHSVVAFARALDRAYEIVDGVEARKPRFDQLNHLQGFMDAQHRIFDQLSEELRKGCAISPGREPQPPVTSEFMESVRQALPKKR